MFIQTEDTPNPETLKFLPGLTVVDQGTYNFKSRDEASHSPLARRLFTVDGVKAVFLAQDFISVTKEEETEWPTLKTIILTEIMDHFTSGLPVIDESKAKNDKSAGQEDNELTLQIKELLDTRVRPAVAMDGGDIIFHSFKEGVVFLEMHGACSGCPSSTVTLKSGIENMLRYYVPEVEEVRAVDENGQELENYM